MSLITVSVFYFMDERRCKFRIALEMPISSEIATSTDMKKRKRFNDNRVSSLVQITSGYLHVSFHGTNLQNFPLRLRPSLHAILNILKC